MLHAIKNRLVGFGLSFLMLFQLLPSTAFAANNLNEEQSQCVAPHKVVSETYDQQGNLVKTFDDGIEVTFFNEDHFVVRDYKNILNMSTPTGPQARSWITLGVAIIKAAGATASTCSAIQYVSGVDVCRIALSYLGQALNPGRYTVNGRFVEAPVNCEPQHSSACQGYWEYDVVK